MWFKRNSIKWSNKRYKLKMCLPTSFHLLVYLSVLINNNCSLTTLCHLLSHMPHLPFYNLLWLPPTLDCAALSPVLQWYDLDSPESTLPPGGMSEEASPFHRLMLMRCFRVDRVYQAVTNYIASVMGEFFITPPFIRWVAIFKLFWIPVK